MCFVRSKYNEFISHGIMNDTFFVSLRDTKKGYVESGNKRKIKDLFFRYALNQVSCLKKIRKYPMTILPPNKKLSEHDARIDSAGSGTQPPRREVIVYRIVCAHICHGDICRMHSGGFQL